MKKILLADDSITIQKVVELTFSEGDYQVVCVSNGAQALKRIPEVRPDIVLLDVIMPERNGYEVCEQIKRSPATSGIPVLLLTGTFEPFDKKRAEAAGAQGHLTKPFESQALVLKVQELIAANPSAVSSADAGGMDVISGGDVYHVDPGRPDEGMRPVAPPPSGLSAVPHRAGGAALETHPEPSPGAPEGEPEESPEPEWSHPATAPPDPGAGGSYVGFADLGVGLGDDGAIVPDRYDESEERSPSTVRLHRNQALGGTSAPAARPDPRSTERVQDAAPEEAIEGLTGAFEIPEGEFASGMAEGSSPEPAWTPPPEAPPAETWQVAEDEAAATPTAPISSPPPAPTSAAAPPRPAPGNGPSGLTPEAIDLIVERVVQRLSDRVVREIAWEVIPQVAEALVRRRIKELEEGGDG